MYTDAVKTRRRRWRLLALGILVLALVLLLVNAAPGRDLGEESAAAIKAAVQRSALQCYAVEGVYPPNLAYLEDHYGLQVNTKDFYVSYDAYASNQPPAIRVTSKR